jgi:hypothetical protein
VNVSRNIIFTSFVALNEFILRYSIKTAIKIKPENCSVLVKLRVTALFFYEIAFSENAPLPWGHWPSQTRQRAGRLGFNSQRRQWWDSLSSPPLPDRLWGSPSLLSSGYRGLFPAVKAAGAWLWPLNSHLVRRLRIRWVIPLFPNTSSRSGP